MSDKMGKFFWGKQREVESLITKYCQVYGQCLDLFVEGMNSYLENGDRDKLGLDVDKTHLAESQADDLLMELGSILYGSALFPESRGDILGLVESLDAVLNKAEASLRMSYHQFITIPKILTEPMKNLVATTRECCRNLRQASEFLFDHYHRAADYYGRVDQLESQADEQEANLIETIFSGDMDTGQKLLLRDLVSSISDIADRAENTSDRIRLILVKRKL